MVINGHGSDNQSCLGPRPCSHYGYHEDCHDKDDNYNDDDDDNDDDNDDSKSCQVLMILGRRRACHIAYRWLSLDVAHKRTTKEEDRSSGKIAIVCREGHGDQIDQGCQ